MEEPRAPWWTLRRPGQRCTCRISITRRSIHTAYCDAVTYRDWLAEQSVAESAPHYFFSLWHITSEEMKNALRDPDVPVQLKA